MILDGHMVESGLGLVFGGAEVWEARLGEAAHSLSFPQMVWSWWILSISKRGEVGCGPHPQPVKGLLFPLDL